MTMSMCGPGLTTTSYKKRKQSKRTKSQQIKFEQQHREYNKSMKRAHAHDQMMSLEDYDLYVRGLYKPKAAKFKEYTPSTAFTAERKTYPSLSDSVGIAPAKESMKYTGERRLIGIATMHKSNMVPIFEDNKHEAIEIARMRR
jgi:hypothetical protein